MEYRSAEESAWWHKIQQEQYDLQWAEYEREQAARKEQEYWQDQERTHLAMGECPQGNPKHWRCNCV